MAAPGVNFNQTAAYAAPPDAVLQAVVAGTTGAPEYTVAMVGPGTVVLTRRYRPTWAIVVAVLGILLFLIGLIALVVVNTETLTVNVLPVEGGGSRVTVSGVGSHAMLHQLAAILSSMPGLPAPGPGGYRLPEIDASTGHAAFAALPGNNSENSGRAAPGWYPDPLGRNERRYYDGIQWTPNVLNGPAASIDPVG